MEETSTQSYALACKAFPENDGFLYRSTYNVHTINGINVHEKIQVFLNYWLLLTMLISTSLLAKGFLAFNIFLGIIPGVYLFICLCSLAQSGVYISTTHTSQHVLRTLLLRPRNIELTVL